MENVLTFIDDLRREAKQHNLELIFEDKDYVYVEGDKTPCKGYFEDQPRLVLAVSMNDKLENWLAVLAHESCHFDQWKENRRLWDSTTLPEGDVYDIISRWDDGEEFNPNILIKSFDLVRTLEHDCEERTIQKMLRYSLPIDIGKYQQAAIAYLHYYNHMQLRRVRSSQGYVPYNDSRLIANMPTLMERNIHFIPDYIVSLFDDFYKKREMNQQLRARLGLKN